MQLSPSMARAWKRSVQQHQVAAAGGGVVASSPLVDSSLGERNSVVPSFSASASDELYHNEMKMLQERRQMLLDSTSRISPIKNRMQQKRRYRQRPHSAAGTPPARRNGHPHTNQQRKKKRHPSEAACLNSASNSLILNPIEPWDSTESRTLDMQAGGSLIDTNIWSGVRGASVGSPVAGLNRSDGSDLGDMDPSSSVDSNALISQEGQHIVASYYRSPKNMSPSNKS